MRGFTTTPDPAPAAAADNSDSNSVLILLQRCKVCKKNFANVYRLQRHMISHDESALLRRFKCADCGKAFKFKHHLKVRTAQPLRMAKVLPNHFTTNETFFKVLWTIVNDSV